MTVNLALHNGSGRTLGYVETSCTALDKDGSSLDTAPATFDNVESDATVFDQAVLKYEGREDAIKCRVVSAGDE